MLIDAHVKSGVNIKLTFELPTKLPAAGCLATTDSVEKHYNNKIINVETDWVQTLPVYWSECVYKHKTAVLVKLGETYPVLTDKGSYMALRLDSLEVYFQLSLTPDNTRSLCPLQ